MLVTQVEDVANLPVISSKRNTPMHPVLKPKLQIIDAGNDRWAKTGQNCAIYPWWMALMNVNPDGGGVNCFLRFFVALARRRGLRLRLGVSGSLIDV
jgi:hypothetical protein